MPYRAKPPGYVCDDCGRDTTAISVDVYQAPYFPWRGDGKARCERCSGMHAFLMLRAAESRVYELTRALDRARAARWHQQLWRWLTRQHAPTGCARKK